MKKLIKGLFNLVKSIILWPWRFLKRLIVKKEKARVEPIERLNVLLDTLKTRNMIERAKIEYLETLNDYNISFTISKETKTAKKEKAKKKEDDTSKSKKEVVK